MTPLTSPVRRALSALIVAACCLSCHHDATAPEVDTDPVIVPDSLNTIAAGEASTCALDAGGATNCWGLNDSTFRFGASGSTLPSSDAPVSSPAGSFVSLARGSSQHHCGIRANGDAVCWGRGGSGQIGGGDVGAAGNPPTTVVGGIKWKQLFTGRLTTCGISVDGDAYCWGLSQRGEIGNSALGTFSTPQLVSGGRKWKVLAPGWLHTCGIDDTNHAYCWGDNTLGAIGQGVSDTTQRLDPVAVINGPEMIDMASGWRHTCGITKLNQVVCWGAGYTGQGGNGSTAWAGSPTAVLSSVKFVRVAAGLSAAATTLDADNDVGTTCALSDRGKAYCWGYNYSGQIGDGTTVTRYAPTRVLGGLIFTNIQLGANHVCARNGAALWCWGSNQFGQIGRAIAQTPAVVTSPMGVSAPFSP